MLGLRCARIQQLVPTNSEIQFFADLRTRAFRTRRPVIQSSCHPSGFHGAIIPSQVGSSCTHSKIRLTRNGGRSLESRQGHRVSACWPICRIPPTKFVMTNLSMLRNVLYSRIEEINCGILTVILNFPKPASHGRPGELLKDVLKDLGLANWSAGLAAWPRPKSLSNP